MENSKEELFKSVSKISLQELYFLYGRELTPADIVLKLGEHKNFEAARHEFQKWDEESVVIMGNYLNQSFRHEPELYTTRDKYIAVSFLKELVNEWQENRLQGLKKSVADPAQREKAESLLKLRLAGVLPHVNLAGTDFTVDWRLKELRETAAPWNHINLEYMEMADDDYVCLYDLEKHRLYLPPENITVLPDNVVMLTIPNELVLDPVAVARSYDLEEQALLGEYPILESLSAKVHPLTETRLPEIIAENIKRLGSPGRKIGR